MYNRPCIVVQSDVFNMTGLGTVLVCYLTSNTGRALSPGNVLLGKGEANLPKPSVVNVTQVATLERSDFQGKIGQVSKARIREVYEGLRLVLEPKVLPPNYGLAGFSK